MTPMHLRPFRHIAIVLAALLAASAFAQAPNPFDIPFPPKSPPFKFLNEHGDEVECMVTPWKLQDLGTVGPTHIHIYAGDHCSMPSTDALSEAYKKVFSSSCDLHDICYFAPGNSKRFCDDMVKWHWDRDCDRAYSGSARDLCRVASRAWRLGLDNQLSMEYWNRSQAWGRTNCHINARPATPPGIAGLSWTAFGTAPLPADTVYAGDAAAVCRAKYQGGVHPGRTAGSNCNIGYGGREWGIGGSEVLVAKASRVNWVPAPANGQMPPQAVVAGLEGARPLVVCRARYENVTYAGKVVAGYCNVGLAGRELTLRPYDVLVFR